MRANILILGFLAAICSGQAIAEPPWQQMRTQRINSPPLWGEAIHCTVMNFSDRDIEVSVTLGSSFPGDPGTFVLGAGQYNGIAVGLGTSVQYCAYEWFGIPGELMASACMDKELLSTPGEFGWGCVEVRPVNFTSEDYE